MADWKEVVNQLAFNAGEKMEEMRRRLNYALGGLGPVKILTYRSYGREDRLNVCGRVIEDRRSLETQKDDYLWENVLDMYTRLGTSQVPYARLAVRFEGVEQEVTAGKDGFFETWLTPDRPLAPRRLWHPVEVELLHPLLPEQTREPVKTTAEVLVPLPGAEYAVICDIDGTITSASAGHLLKLARHVFLGDAHTRLPFPGVAALYRALFVGRTGNSLNPLFYVSSSPGNLYDLLAQLFQLLEIPVGPVCFRRDWGLTLEDQLPTRQHSHKDRLIRQVLEFYPDLPFLLVGGGQEDREIYAGIQHDFPHRVKAVYICGDTRDLKPSPASPERAEIAAGAAGGLYFAGDSLSIARSAVKDGLILPEAPPSIHSEKNKDEAPPTRLEKLLGEPIRQAAPVGKLHGAGVKETGAGLKTGAAQEPVPPAPQVAAGRSHSSAREEKPRRKAKTPNKP